MTEDNKQLPIVEIVTGVILAIILIVFALPRLMYSGQGEVIENEASTLFYKLAKAKNRSLKTKLRVGVQFNGNSGYTIFEDVNGNGTADAGEPLEKTQLATKIQFGVNLTPSLENVWGTGNITQAIDLEGDNTQLFLNPKGSANRGGAVYFINKSDIGDTNAHVMAVKIIGASGEISVLKASPSSSPPWKLAHSAP